MNVDAYIYTAENSDACAAANIRFISNLNTVKMKMYERDYIFTGGTTRNSCRMNHIYTLESETKFNHRNSSSVAFTFVSGHLDK